MSTIKRIVLILLVIILLGFVGGKIVSYKIVSHAKSLSVKEIDLSSVKDGKYPGHYEISPVKVSVETLVRNGKIAEINLVEHFNGKGVSAEKIIDYIIEKQSLKVDCISGATVSSVAIKKAVENSLTEE